MLQYRYFEAINGAIGSDSLVEADIAEGQRSLREELMTSVHYDGEALRNGNPQGFVITASDSYYKYKIEALPGDELYVGDVIYSHGEHWVVVKTRVASPFQTIGLMWLCNCLFRWQNGTPRIIQQWGVLDSGVYSTTKDGNETVKTADKQYKIYLPYNEDTSKIFIDKRFATEKMYDSHLNEILSVYAITGYDAISSSYGHGGHLLVLNARSDDYVKEKDNVDLMVCDYIAPIDDDDTTFISVDGVHIAGDENWNPIAYRLPVPGGVISGYPTMRIGATRRYCANFEVAGWELRDAPSGVAIDPTGNECLVTLALQDDLIGTIFSVCAVDAEENESLMKVEVIS